MHGHRIAVAARDPGGLEPRRDAFGQPREVRIELLRGEIAGIVGEGVVLIGMQGLFQTRFAPQSQPCPRCRGIAQIGDRESQQPSSQGVDRRPDHPTHFRRV